jgi:hypothetical protein
MQRQGRNLPSAKLMTDNGGSNLRPIAMSYHHLVILSHKLGEFSRCGLDVSVLFFESTVLATLEYRVPPERYDCNGLSV